MKTFCIIALLVLLNMATTHAFWGLFDCDGDREGGGCAVWCPCEGDMTCEAGSQRCRKPGKLGDSCHATRPCGSGLTCEAFSHVCRGEGKEGDPCHATRPCGPGLTCEAGAHKCRRPGKEGDSCHATKPCGYPYFCYLFKCKMAGAGEPCSDDGNCPKGLYCNLSLAACQYPVQRGGSCGYGERCQNGLSCRGRGIKAVCQN